MHRRTSRAARAATLAFPAIVMIAVLSGGSTGLLARAAEESARMSLCGELRVVSDDADSDVPADYTAETAPAPPAPTADETVSADSLTVTFDDRGMLSYGDIRTYMQSDNEEHDFTASLVARNLSSDAGPEPYPAVIEENDGEIMAVSYSMMNGSEYINLAAAGQVRNVTSLPNSVLERESEKLPQFKIVADGSPQVLIMHTHTTESYEPYERDFYDSSFISRTTDENKNVVAVGRRIALKLTENGIGVVHDTTLHDYPSFNGSYGRSAVTVRSCLEQYPTIKVVIDIHRDAIEKENGVRIAPVADIDGKSAAQIMIISGCDDGTMNMPDYLQNFRLASLLQQQLEGDNPGLTRPVLFDYRKYNQDITTGSLLIEVGAHSNSLEQALYTADLAGESIAKALLQCTGENG